MRPRQNQRGPQGRPRLGRALVRTPRQVYPPAAPPSAAQGNHATAFHSAGTRNGLTRKLAANAPSRPTPPPSAPRRRRSHRPSAPHSPDSSSELTDQDLRATATPRLPRLPLRGAWPRDHLVPPRLAWPTGSARHEGFRRPGPVPQPRRQRTGSALGQGPPPRAPGARWPPPSACSVLMTNHQSRPSRFPDGSPKPTELCTPPRLGPRTAQAPPPAALQSCCPRGRTRRPARLPACPVSSTGPLLLRPVRQPMPPMPWAASCPRDPRCSGRDRLPASRPPPSQSHAKLQPGPSGPPEALPPR